MNLQLFFIDFYWFHDIKLLANNQYNANPIFVKSALWSDPYKVAVVMSSGLRIL